MRESINYITILDSGTRVINMEIGDGRVISETRDSFWGAISTNIGVTTKSQCSQNPDYDN